MGASVVIADDHAIVRAGVRALAEAAGCDVVAETDNGISAVGLIKRHRPALAVLDIAMPHANGIEALEEIRRWSPETRIVILTGLTSRGLLQQARAAGVDGLFLKSDDPGELAAALPRILVGEKAVSASVERIILTGESSAQLTNRELQVLHAVARGESNATIAERLGISASTVDKHRSSLMRKLSVHSVGELLAVALREGLLDTAHTL